MVVTNKQQRYCTNSSKILFIFIIDGVNLDEPLKVIKTENFSRFAEYSVIKNKDSTLYKQKSAIDKNFNFNVLLSNC